MVIMKPEKTAFVPNEEIRQELTTAVERKTWNEMLVFQQESENLLDATLDLNGSEVAKQIEKIHNEYVSVIQYHNENSLSSVLAIAYLSAMQYYFKPIRELPTGRGFADFVFIPKPEYKDDYPALIVELKWNRNAHTALQQIEDKKYPSSVLNYTGDILLVGINYDKESKEHQCVIKKIREKINQLNDLRLEAFTHILSVAKASRSIYIQANSHCAVTADTRINLCTILYSLRFRALRQISFCTCTQISREMIGLW